MSEKKTITSSPLERENTELRALNAALEKRLADAELSVSQTNLSALIENADGSIWSVDVHYGLILGNQMFHHNVSAALGRRLEKGESVLLPGFSPEAVAEWKGYYDRALQGEAFSVEAKTRFRESPRYIEYHFNPLCEENGSIHGVTVFGRDITERKQAVEEVQKSHEQLLKFASHVPGMLYQIERLPDGSFRVPFTTEAIRDIFGCSPEDVREDFSPIEKAIHPEDLPRINSDIEESFQNMTPFQCEYRVLLPGQPIRWIEAHSMPEKLLNGNIAWNGFNTDITERKQAENKLKESERKLRELNSDLRQSQAVAHLGNWKWDLKTSAVEWSDEMFRIFGIDKDSYTGRLGGVIAKVVHPDDLHIVLPENAPKFAGNQPQEYRIIWPDGSIRHIWAKAGETILDEQGSPAYLTGIAQDVTERKRIEENLRTSELRFRSAAESLTDVIYEWDLGERIDWYGDIDGMMGYPRGEFPRTFSSWLTLLHPDDRDMVRAAVDGQLKGVAPYNIEYRIKRKDGEWRWWSARGIAFRDGRGEPCQWVGSITDITDRREVENALRESEDKFKYIFDYSMIGKSFTLPSGEIQVNKAFCEMLGYSQTELQNKRWQEITHPDDIAETEKLVATLLSGELESGRFIKRYLHKNGSTVWADVSTLLRRDRDGAPLYFVTSINDITDRKQAENALRESEDKFRKAFMTSPDSININRIQDGTYISVNPGFTQIMGYTEEDVIGKSSLALDIWEDPNDRKRLVEGLRKDGFVSNLEARFRRKDGGTIYGLMSASLIELGGVPHILNISRDITERKLAEEALQKTQMQLQAIMDYSPALISIKDLDGNIILANLSFSVLDAPPLNELIGKNVFDLFPKEVAQQLWDNDLAALHAKAPVRSEEVVKHKDGTWHTYWTVKFPIYLQSDQPFGICAISNDITERKQAEKELRTKDELLRMTSEMAKVGGWEFDAQTLEGTWTDAVAAIHDLDPGDPTNVKLGVSFYQPDSRREIEQSIQKAIESAIPYDLELQMITARGNPKWVRTMGIPIVEDGRVIKIRGIFQDITEQKKSHEQLFNTLGELKRSNAELEQFAYVASHDLQEPLRTVAGMVQLLQQRYKGQLDDRADEYINLAYDGATRMQGLINDLLAYSRVDRRNNPMLPTDANAALKSALRNLEVSISEQGATVTSDSLPTVDADSTQLTLLFQNLIGNAIKFHSERPPLIHVGVEELGDAWRFSVRDNGIGIEPQYYERIFLVFQRLHTRREYPGTGIGLSICKKIVERHGGRIWIESEPGQGATFHFTLPHRR